MRTFNPMVGLIKFKVYKKLFNGGSVIRLTLGVSGSSLIYIHGWGSTYSIE